MRTAILKIQTFYLALCIAFCSLFVYLAYHCYFSDSEIWLLALTQKTFSFDGFHAVYYKWFFHIVVYVTAFWAHNNLLIYDITRFLFAAFGIASVFLLATTFARIYNKKQLFLPVTLFCITSSLFFNQGFRIRADILALFLHAVFLFLIFHQNKSSRKNIFIFALLQLAMLLTTAKAFIFINLHIFCGLHFLFQTEKEKIGKQILISIFIPASLGLFILSLMAFFAPDNTFLISLYSAADFYIKSFDPGLGGASFFKSVDFMYLIRFLRLSMVHTFIFLVWLILFVRHLFSKTKNSTDSFLYLYCALLLIQVLLYNQKLPFFLGAFLTPAVAIFFCTFDGFIAQQKRMLWLPPVLIIIACGLCWTQFVVNIRQNNNLAQKAFIAELQQYKQKHPNISIYDVIGLLPQDSSYYHFIGPGESSRSEEILSSLRQNPPDIYLTTYKNIFFGDNLSLFLKNNYLEYTAGVWVKVKNIRFSQNGSMPPQLIRMNKQDYWLFPTKKPTLVYSYSTQKDIMADVVFLDSHLKLTQDESVWIGVPSRYLNFSIATIPLPHFQQDPFLLFSFDTGF